MGDDEKLDLRIKRRKEARTPQIRTNFRQRVVGYRPHLLFEMKKVNF